MPTLQTRIIPALAAGLFLLTNAQAQQTTPAASSQAAPAAPAPAATPAAKPSQGTTAKPRTSATTKGPATPLTLKTQKDKTSYAIGLNIGQSLHRDSVDVDTAILLRGLKDALAGGKTLLTPDETKTVLSALQMDLRNKQQQKMLALAEGNKKEGDAFLAANKTQDGVVTLPSGLQYKVLTEGTGPKPAASDAVVCNYRGTLLDHTEFDSSYKRGQPATFQVNQVIKGWTEALQLMPVGSKWQLFIPSDLAYGQRGAGPGSGIGPDATLIFEVELLSIQPKTQPAAAPQPAAPNEPPKP
jgi:FKBP-type peptidyl-prolyl cis-trans isomerase FklB